MSIPSPDGACRFCGATDWAFVADYTAPPSGETNFGFSPYRRALWQCGGCRHVVNAHAMDLQSIYDSAYWDRTYGGDRMAATFRKIMALPTDRSDNRARASRVDGVWRELTGNRDPGTLFDIGSGLAVFPAVMREIGWDCVALDPDMRGAKHAQEMAQVDAVSGDFMATSIERVFDLISFNKVLEHVLNPVEMLSRARAFLKPNGVCYVELPDGNAALKDSPEREEFFVEHYDAYSPDSIGLLASHAGFQMKLLDQVVEPSGKYTLRAFLMTGSE